MPTFIIRNQGFFYTDEYYAPGDVFRHVYKKTFTTKAAAEKARGALVRKWVRAGRIGDFVFNHKKASDAIGAYLRSAWPERFRGVDDLYRVEIPADATDEQVDDIVDRMGVTFAQVFEVEDEVSAGGEEEEEEEEEEDDDEYEAAEEGDEFEDVYEEIDGHRADGLYFGPSR